MCCRCKKCDIHNEAKEKNYSVQQIELISTKKPMKKPTSIYAAAL